MPLHFDASTAEIKHKEKGGVAKTSALSLSGETIFRKQVFIINLKQLIYFLLQVLWKSGNKSACVRIQKKINHPCDLMIDTKYRDT